MGVLAIVRVEDYMRVHIKRLKSLTCIAVFVFQVLFCTFEKLPRECDARKHSAYTKKKRYESESMRTPYKTAKGKANITKMF